jgi:hypothetical protein
MSQHEITRDNINALLECLPLFEKPGRGLERNADGSLSMPFPVHDEDVEEFFRRVAQHGWLDYGYEPEKAARMLEDAEFIERTSLGQVKTILTYCSRIERFCDGHQESLLKGGQIVALLKRLKAIRERM